MFLPVEGGDGIHPFDRTEVRALASRRPTPSPVKNGTAEREVAAAFVLFK